MTLTHCFDLWCFLLSLTFSGIFLKDIFVKSLEKYYKLQPGFYFIINYIFNLISQPQFPLPPFLSLPPPPPLCLLPLHTLLLHFCSQRGRPPMDIETWCIKLR